MPPGSPDPRPPARVRDKALLSILHRDWRECVLCGEHRGRLNLHHIFDRDDVRGNLVMLCGSGTTGCHGKVTVNDRETKRALGLYLVHERDDVLPHIASKLDDDMRRARAWISRTHYVEV